ncbi:MAG: hypothetical protein AAF585_20605 [Verrucomicrobiota bacterium]
MSIWIYLGLGLASSAIICFLMKRPKVRPPFHKWIIRVLGLIAMSFILLFLMIGLSDFLFRITALYIDASATRIDPDVLGLFIVAECVLLGVMLGLRKRRSPSQSDGSLSL